MQEWPVNRGDLFSITLAADTRFGIVDYANDQTWEMVFQSGEPLAIAVQTTYGLRARLMRIFPIFYNGKKNLANPASFHISPRITACYPNFARINYSPFTGIDVVSEYWVPNSQSLACRTMVTNSSIVHARLRLDWSVLLAPLGEGQGMTCISSGKHPYLVGNTQGLVPVFYLNGDVECSSGAFPGLSTYFELAPGNKHQHTWAEAAAADSSTSLDLAGSAVGHPWDSTAARIELTNRSQNIEIECGRADWNLVFTMSRQIASSLLTAAAPQANLPPFVLNRQPDHNPLNQYDVGSGSYTALQAYYLAGLVLPAASAEIKNVVRKYIGDSPLTAPDSPDSITPVQVRRILPPPILACLAWKVFIIDNDRTFLEEVFSQLVSLTEAWFSSDHDRDQDGFPEWDNLAQTGFYDHYLFNQNLKPGQKDDITEIESPSLGAFLFNEINTLLKIGEVLEKADLTVVLASKVESLKEAVESTWDRFNGTYRYRDRVSHQAKDYPGSSHEDITLLLPLWAHLPHHRRANSLVKKSIFDSGRYFLPFGLPACPNDHTWSGCADVHLEWNQLIIEGLLGYGYRREAAELFSRLMGGICISIKKRGSFSHLVNARSGEPSGERNTLDGLAPYGLFLDILGIKILSPNSIIIEGFNPFSWPVTVKYRGLTLIRQEKSTKVIFPDGQTTIINGPKRQLVSLE